MNFLIYLFIFPLMFTSCINYIPCRGQDYIIENTTPKKLIEKISDFRKINPDYFFEEDYIDPNLPWRTYITLYWKDLDLRIHLNIHTGENSTPTSLKFSHIGDKDIKWFKDINSKELDKKLNQQYIEKFENEILNKLNLKWERETCW